MDSRSSPHGESSKRAAKPTASGSGDASPLDLADRIDSLVRTYVPATDGAQSHVRPNEFSSAVGISRPAIDSPALLDERPLQGRLPEELRTAKVMIIDQREDACAVRHHLEREGYTEILCTFAEDQAVDELRRELPDVLLLATPLPGVPALDILRIKAGDPTLSPIPVIVLTVNDPVSKREALEAGATDFLTKPVDPSELVPRVRNALIIKKQSDRIADEKFRFDQLLRRRTAEVEASREQLILSLARAAEHRDNETGNHVIRVGCFAGIIAHQLGWSKDRVEMLVRAAQLHDVGKIGVPDDILFKAGKLDPQEFEMIKRHCAWGKRIIQPFSDHELQMIKSHARVGEKILHVRHSPMLMLAARIAQTHHENWDGSGYPLGLAGEDIPLEGRITAVADVYDALSSRRPYKEPFPREKCFQILEELRGQKFDPRVLDAFFTQADQIIEVQLELMDDGEVRWNATR